VWHSAETLAQRLGLSVRSIRRALAELADAGLIRIVRDYALRTRRRIVLAWRETKGAFVAAKSAGESRPKAPATRACLPLSGSEEVEPRNDDDAVLRVDSSESSSSLPQAVEQTPDEPTEAERTAKLSAFQTTAAVKIASKIVGPGPATEGRIEALVQEHGKPTEVAAALVIARKRKPSEFWAFVRGVLRNWRREGGATPEQRQAGAQAIAHAMMRWPTAEPAT